MISSVAGLVTSLLLLFAVPALAANNNSSNGSNNGGNQDRLLRSAERACRQTAQNKGYDVRDVTGSRYTGNDTARVSLRLRRKNQSFDGRCSYDGRADKASLDVQGSGDSGSGDRRLLQSAERACRQTAQNRGYEVRDITGSKATGDRTARVDLRLRRKDRSYDGRCSYDSRDDRASLDVQRAAAMVAITAAVARATSKSAPSQPAGPERMRETRSSRASTSSSPTAGTTRSRSRPGATATAIAIGASMTLAPTQPS